MARPYRLQAENTLYHIISRGNNRCKIFFHKSDYPKYLEYLEKAKEKYGFYLYAYVLMPNHIHLLIETPQANISNIMHSLNTSYATYLSVKHRRVGHLFQGRYKSIIVDKDEYLLKLTAYIHMNPLRAKLVKRLEDYLWSSYDLFLHRKEQGLISWNVLGKYINHGPDDYRKYVYANNGNTYDFKEKLYAGFILGQPRFIKDTLEDLKIQIEKSDISYNQRIEKLHEIDEVTDFVAKRYKTEVDMLFKAANKQNEAKKVAIYVIKKLCSDTNKEIGKKFGVSYSAVIKAERSMEHTLQRDNKLRKEVNLIISHFRG